MRTDRFVDRCQMVLGGFVWVFSEDRDGSMAGSRKRVGGLSEPLDGTGTAPDHRTIIDNLSLQIDAADVFNTSLYI